MTTLLPLPAYKRELRYRPRRPKQRGRDVLAVERCLHRKGFRQLAATYEYGAHAHDNIAAFQHHEHLTADGVYGPLTHKHLSWQFDNYERWLYRHEIVHEPPAASPRDRLMHQTWSLYAEAPESYHPVRPDRLYDVGQPITYWYDCSWLAKLIFYRAGLPNPNGGAYTGEGSTETLRVHGRMISTSAARPGDLVFYGYYGSWSDPAHVAVYVGNGQVIGFGSSGGPRRSSMYYRTIREVRSYVA